jgi:hypothetical protein
LYFSYLPIYHYVLDINYIFWLLFDLISCILCIGIFPNNKKNIFLLKSHSQHLWLLRPKTHLNQMNLINFKKKILLIINGKIISNIEKDKSTFEKEKWHLRKKSAILVKWAKFMSNDAKILNFVTYIYEVPL